MKRWKRNRPPRQWDQVDEAVYEYGKLVSRKSTGRTPKKPAHIRSWLKANPPGSPARKAWLESKELKERLSMILKAED